ncbi:MAG: mechanosensitive ion channel family protein [Geobacteraceae bacterium]
MDSILSFYRLQETDSLHLFWLKELLVAAIIFALFWIAARLLRYFLITWGPRFTSFTSTDLDDRILLRITPLASLLVICAGIYFAVGYLPLPDKVKLVVSGALFVVNVGILTNMAYRITDEILNWYTDRVAEQTGSSINRQLIPLVEKLVSIFLIGAALIVVLKHFSYDILSLVTALGIGSLAIGLAAKDTIANMISGFTLMIDSPFRIGDRIKLVNGQAGEVMDIGLRSTKILGMDSTVMIIPNSELCNSTVVNMVRPTPVTQGRITIGVGYGSDVERVKELLLEIARENHEVIEDPAPLVLFTSFGDSALNILLLFWVNEPARVGLVTDRLNCAIVRCFRENGIEMPSPVRTVIMEKGAS